MPVGHSRQFVQEAGQIRVPHGEYGLMTLGAVGLPPGAMDVQHTGSASRVKSIGSPVCFASAMILSSRNSMTKSPISMPVAP
jgi:hypothetical protein